MLYIPVSDKSLLWIYEVNRAYHDKHHQRNERIMRGVPTTGDFKTGLYLVSKTGLCYRVVSVSKSGKTIKVQPLNNDGTPVFEVAKLDRDVIYYRLSAHQFHHLLKIQALLDYHRHVAHIIHTATVAVQDRGVLSVVSGGLKSNRLPD